MELELNWIPRRSLGYSLARSEQQDQAVESYLLSSVSGVYDFTLNNTGALIWQLCDEQRSIAEIVSMLKDLYPEARDDIEDHTIGIVGELMDYGALYSFM